MPRGDLIEAYRKRYDRSYSAAYYELAALGFEENVRIQQYEREGIEWEYKVDGYTGDMK